jgi:hypothetical protein
MWLSIISFLLKTILRHIEMGDKVNLEFQLKLLFGQFDANFDYICKFIA